MGGDDADRLGWRHGQCEQPDRLGIGADVGDPHQLARHPGHVVGRLDQGLQKGPGRPLRDRRPSARPGAGARRGARVAGRTAEADPRGRRAGAARSRGRRHRPRRGAAGADRTAGSVRRRRRRRAARTAQAPAARVAAQVAKTGRRPRVADWLLGTDPRGHQVLGRLGPWPRRGHGSADPTAVREPTSGGGRGVGKVAQHEVGRGVAPVGQRMAGPFVEPGQPGGRPGQLEGALGGDLESPATRTGRSSWSGSVLIAQKPPRRERRGSAPSGSRWKAASAPSPVGGEACVLARRSR